MTPILKKELPEAISPGEMRGKTMKRFLVKYFYCFDIGGPCGFGPLRRISSEREGCPFPARADFADVVKREDCVSCTTIRIRGRTMMSAKKTYGKTAQLLGDDWMGGSARVSAPGRAVPEIIQG